MDRYAWQEPGAFEEAPGIFRIPLPLPGDVLKAVNVYAIRDGERLVLIDAGWALAESEDQLARALKSLDHGLDDIREFLVTHVHRDHYTQAVTLRDRTGAEVSLGEGERVVLRAIQTRDDGLDVRDLRAAGAPALAAQVERQRREYGELMDLSHWRDPDRWLDDGLEIPLETRTLRVIATPGHTRGHVVFHDPEHQVLFAGDHVLPHITPSIGIELKRPVSPLREYLASLRLTRQLPDARLFPAHGPVTDSVHARVDELIEHHERRLAATLAAVDHGATTPYEVALILTWTRHERHLDELDLFNQMMAVNETVAHLRVLVEHGDLREEIVDDVHHFLR